MRRMRHSVTEALKLDDDELTARLVKERRVSRWMVKRRHIFTHGRPNVFPSDDYGVRNGWCAAKKLSEMLKPKEFRWLAERR